MDNLQQKLIQLRREIEALKQSYPYVAYLFPGSISANNPAKPDNSSTWYNTYRITYENNDRLLLSYAFPQVDTWFEPPLLDNTQLVHCKATMTYRETRPQGGSTVIEMSGPPSVAIFSTRKILKIEQIS